MQRDPDGLARRRWAAARTRCSTRKRGTGGRGQAAHLSRRGPGAPRALAGRCPRTARSSAPPATCIRAGCGPTSRSRATAARRACSARRPTTTSRPARCPGTSSMTATPPDWRVQAAQGRRAQRLRHVRHRSARRGTSRWRSCRPCSTPAGRGADPFATDVDVEGQVTHGHLPENDDHGGRPPRRPARPARLLARAVARRRQGRDPGLRLRPGRPDSTRPARPPGAGAPGPRPHVRQPRRAAHDLPHDHRLQGALQPRRRASPTRSPNGKVDFDSGELGFGPRGFTAAANRDTWTTPKGLKPGTYTYFCRVHPFMRGAFKVKPKR